MPTAWANGGYLTRSSNLFSTANVYKAIDSLTTKGAVEFTTNKKKSYFVYDWKQFLNRKQQQFNETLSSLEENLGQLGNPIEDDEQVYQIVQVDLVIEYSIKLINNAQHPLMVEAEPDALPLLKMHSLEQLPEALRFRLKPITHWFKNMHVIVRQNDNEIYKAPMMCNLSLPKSAYLGVFYN